MLMSGMGRKQTFGQCPVWVESGRCRKSFERDEFRDRSDKQIRVRTRLRICAKKTAYQSEEKALEAIRLSGLELRTYRCDRCRLIHLTSRTKGKRPPLLLA
jgi:hypothetical protein